MHGQTGSCGRWRPVSVEYEALRDGGFDPVERPRHYQTESGFECKDVIREALGVDGYRYWCLGNVIKYVFRFRKKNGIEDLRKALWYLREFMLWVECEDE